jgi:hypothetical protein
MRKAHSDSILKAVNTSRHFIHKSTGFLDVLKYLAREFAWQLGAYAWISCRYHKIDCGGLRGLNVMIDIVSDGIRLPGGD